MVQVHNDARRANAASVRWSRFSLCYTGLYVLKLATTPLLAYLSEPLPWLIPQRSVVVYASLDAFNNATFDFLHELYNSQTMTTGRDTHFDSRSLTFVQRRPVVLPLEAVPPRLFNSHLIRFPGAMFYGLGLRTFVADFLIQNVTTRRQSRLFQCQRAYYFGKIWMDECLWLEPVTPDGTTSDDVYMAYYAAVVWEGSLWGWFKLAFRCLLTLFILRVLWQRYCRHYIPLLRALQDIGVEERFSRYQVIVGDPTYLILSDRRVAVVMVADIMTTPAYVVWSTLRVCQFTDVTAFCLGCVYSTRFVWDGYVAMRFLSYLAKARRWERHFAPIDPAVLGFVAVLYGGPVLSLIGNTSLMTMFHAAWSLFVPSRVEMQRIDGASGFIAGTILMASFPVTLSFALQRLTRRRKQGSGMRISRHWATLTHYVRCSPSLHAIAPPMRATTQTSRSSDFDSVDSHSRRSFNDFKNRLFFAFMRWLAPEPHRKIGGSLHALHLQHPEYREMPLFSCRAADCFVLCYTPDGQLELQVRLSFLDCLDTRLHDPELAIPTCTSQHRASYATCSGEPCATFKPTATSVRPCIHSPLGGSKWMA
ncbi:hypothetical protein AC1031_021035 [Aphanomyces cochlioides]|nr:hypothetical protein AC1031_021035 [Aphanomyces cochlioides]